LRRIKPCSATKAAISRQTTQLYPNSGRVTTAKLTNIAHSPPPSYHPVHNPALHYDTPQSTITLHTDEDYYDKKGEAAHASHIEEAGRRYLRHAPQASLAEPLAIATHSPANLYHSQSPYRFLKRSIHEEQRKCATRF
jgi:hypothetical protein